MKKCTPWHFEDYYFIVCDCSSCKVPMIVSKRHTTKLNQEELIDLMWIFANIKRLSIEKGARLDLRRRRIKNHWHCHIRSNEKRNNN